MLDGALDGALDGYTPEGGPGGEVDDYLRTILRNWHAHTPDFAPPSDINLSAPTSPPPTTSTSAAPADPPVSAADVASIRQFLEGFNGDFRALFGADGSGSR